VIAIRLRKNIAFLKKGIKNKGNNRTYCGIKTEKNAISVKPLSYSCDFELSFEI
jgi:hypothetical protein